MRKKWHLAEELIGGLDLPWEAMSKLPRMELSGNRELFIDGHRGVLDYSDTFIRILAGSIMLEVSGERLDLGGVTPSAAVIRGEITRIEFK
ncbi:MAG TPA: YabP/YqfC family sporulation protein [Candidatus Acidoferrum sp.]|nr:YabP/YqfC family sporulation protein [Candidatus Acidoferrum sp.]